MIKIYNPKTLVVFDRRFAVEYNTENWFCQEKNISLNFKELRHQLKYNMIKKLYGIIKTIIYMDTNPQIGLVASYGMVFEKEARKGHINSTGQTMFSIT